jgi:hypothetical protein
MQAEKRHFHRPPCALTGRMQGKVAMSIKKHKAQTPKEINAANKEFWDSGYKALDSNGLPNFKNMTHPNPRSMMGLTQFVVEAINELGQLAKNPLIAEGDLSQEKLRGLNVTLTTLLDDDCNLLAFVDAMKMIGWLYCKAGIDLGAIVKKALKDRSKKATDKQHGERRIFKDQMASIYLKKPFKNPSQAAKNHLKIAEEKNLKLSKPYKEEGLEKLIYEIFLKKRKVLSAS